MFPSLARKLADSLPDPLVKMGVRFYEGVYVPGFASGKRAYDLGGFEMELDLAESPMMVSRRFRDYEPTVSQALADGLEPGDTYVDVGSNKGYHLLEAAGAVGEEGRVYGFEPHPGNVEDLERNVERNGFANVEVHEKAVYDRNGTRGFALGEKSGHGSVVDEGDLEVETVTFDTFLQAEAIAPEEVDLVKIDVEGAEAAVLSGMEDFLRQAEDCRVVVETHEGADLERMRAIVDETGSRLTVVGEYWQIEL